VGALSYFAMLGLLGVRPSHFVKRGASENMDGTKQDVQD
jgi:hypothetical protein